MILLLLNNLFHNFFRGVMMPKLNTISSITYSTAYAVSMLLFIARFGVYGTFYGFITAWSVEFITCLIIYLSKKWKNKAYREAEQRLLLAKESA